MAAGGQGGGGPADAQAQLLTEMGLDYEMQNNQLQTASGRQVRRESE
jgi:hypothetical protein